MKKLIVFLIVIGLMWGLVLAMLETFATLGVILVIVSLVLLYVYRERKDIKTKLYWALGIGIVLSLGFLIDKPVEETSKNSTKSIESEVKTEKEDVIEETVEEEVTENPSEKEIIDEEGIEEEVAEEVIEESIEKDDVVAPIVPPVENVQSESFKNCTEMRKVHPSGVPSNHPAYESKHDRDKDNYACER